ncbi:DUF1385 domain-containing protein [Fictibacillus arsenicus]|uniref:DUF1385 domain-containing protein n=1 Tax=Fictibacillus arsenicus TaxID=255247 RepID=A0A1V3G955_9BACL|nr:DUF1385 domain-containing protein [Fictibacillus arsenicus]OOE12506.1 hypothetical protein UN64_10500 [Fictibacillus arsenicus]
MNIGGRALLNGIMFQSENYTVKARYDKEGNIFITEEQTPTILDNKFVSFMSSLPFLRGIVALFRILWSVRKIFIISFILVIPFTLLLQNYKVINDSNINELTIGVQYLYIVLIIIIFWGINRKYGKFHGAEHKVINTFKRYGKVELASAIKTTRISSRCGTNLVFIVVVLKLISLISGVNSPLVNLSIWLVAYEIFELQETKLAFLSKPFITIGEFLQKLLTTSEPTVYELKPAVEGINHLIKLERTNN